jgi:putative SOS response-associated peptidase YedK
MPGILDAGGEARWLDPGASADELRALFLPYPGERMGAYPVSAWVSDPKHEGPKCLEPMGA